MSDMNPMFKVVDYQVATNYAQATDCAIQGYEPYGEPNLTGSAFAQAFVKRAPFDVSSYMAVMKGLLVMVTKVQTLADDPLSLFDHDELLDLGASGLLESSDIAELLSDGKFTVEDLITLHSMSVIDQDDIIAIARRVGLTDEQAQVLYDAGVIKDDE